MENKNANWKRVSIAFGAIVAMVLLHWGFWFSERSDLGPPLWPDLTEGERIVNVPTPWINLQVSSKLIDETFHREARILRAASNDEASNEEVDQKLLEIFYGEEWSDTKATKANCSVENPALDAAMVVRVSNLVKADVLSEAELVADTVIKDGILDSRDGKAIDRLLTKMTDALRSQRELFLFECDPLIKIISIYNVRDLLQQIESEHGIFSNKTMLSVAQPSELLTFILTLESFQIPQNVYELVMKNFYSTDRWALERLLLKARYNFVASLFFDFRYTMGTINDCYRDQLKKARGGSLSSDGFSRAATESVYWQFFNLSGRKFSAKQCDNLPKVALSAERASKTARVVQHDLIALQSKLRLLYAEAFP